MVLLRRLTPAAQLPLALTLEEARLHLRVDHSAEDSLIELLIRAVAQTWETYVKLPLMRAEYLALSSQFSSHLDLGAGDIVAINTVRYQAANGAVVLVEPERYSISLYDTQTLLLDFGAAGVPRTAPSPEAVQITFTAGAASAADVPPLRKQALLLLLGHWYENKQAVVTGQTAPEVPLTARWLMDLERVPTL